MALDTIAEYLAESIGGRLIKAVVSAIFYWPGWLGLRVVTLGRYPPNRPTPHNREFVVAFGVALLLAAITFSYAVRAR